MKSLLFSILCLTYVSAYSQTTFESESDVLFYLNTKSSFSNKGNGVTLSFTDMGSRMSSNKGINYFNPDVTLISRTRAIVQYQSLTNPDGFAKIIVDCNQNIVVDKSDMTKYSAYSYEEKEPIRKNERIPITSTKKIKKVNYLTFTMKQEFQILLLASS